MKVTQENTDYTDDPYEIGFFKDANEYYNTKTASEKKDILWKMLYEEDDHENLVQRDYIWVRGQSLQRLNFSQVVDLQTINFHSLV